MMTNSLAVYEQMNALQTAAQALYASGFFSDVKTQAQAMVKVMAGAEIGLPPFASMSGIHIVQGKPVLGANLIATLVKNDPRYNYRVARADNAACILEWIENGKTVGQSSFTMDEATAAGLTGKDNWRKYPSDMLFARALTRGARRYAPGIFGGAPIYTPEEMGVDTDEEGHIVQGEVINVTSAQSTQPPANAPLYEDKQPPTPQPKATPPKTEPAQTQPQATPPPTNGKYLYANGVVVRPEKLDAYNAYREAHGGNVPEAPKHLDNWIAQRNPQPALAESPATGDQSALAIDDPDAVKAASDTALGLFD